MKMIIVVALALVAVAVAAPTETPKILRSEFEQQPDGNFVFGFETENGISQQVTGEIRQVLDEDKKPHDVVVYRGSYSYPNPEGKVETVNYIADEDGFRAEGESIPKVPAAAAVAAARR